MGWMTEGLEFNFWWVQVNQKGGGGKERNLVYIQ
jgi:hypothetical protein